MLRMGREEEDEQGQKELDKLEKFLDKYYDGALELSDVEQLNIDLFVGSIVCLGIAEGDEAIAKLKATK